MKKLIILILIINLSLEANSQVSECESFKISAIEDFNPEEKRGYVPFYKDEKQKALAVNAVEYKDQFSLASYTFTKEKGKYKIDINTLSEFDGESTYKLFVNGKLVSEVQNNPSDKDYTVQNFKFGNVNLKPKDTISIAFNSHTNGKIPEGESTAYSRGRWTELEITHICK